jgi:two-component system invasion response regulator UvrY
MVNVLLVDDHELVRTGIERLLSSSQGINVVGVACCGEDAIKMVDALKPDVVLMDIHMPGMGGIEASRKIYMKHPGVKIVALSALSDGPIPHQLMSEGAQGYVSKSCSVAELIKAVEIVHAGKRYLSADVASGMALSHLQGTPTGSPFEQLSKREMQIVLMALQGKDVAEIAGLLMISPKTVSTYRYRVYAKLGVKNDVGLVRLSQRHKFDTELLFSD